MFDGKIDEINVYHRVLEPDEVAKIYADAHQYKLENKEDVMKEIHDVIIQLLHHLLDSYHDADRSWGQCWEELDWDAQDEVKEVRKAANELLWACYTSGLFVKEGERK